MVQMTKIETKKLDEEGKAEEFEIRKEEVDDGKCLQKDVCNRV